MPSNPDTFYLTASEYRSETQHPSLVGTAKSPILTDTQVQSLLLEAMTVIDAYIGPGWTPYADDQEFIFPREQDVDAADTPYVPRPIAIVTRKVADTILLKRPTSGNRGVLPQEVISEGNEGHSYTKHSRMIEPEQGFEWLPPEVFGMLQKYRRVGGVWALDETDDLTSS